MEQKKELILPEVSKGEVLKVNKIEKEQKFTSPPSRYTEASLVKKMEENGIGRPSTYAQVVSTLKERGICYHGREAFCTHRAWYCCK